MALEISCEYFPAWCGYLLKYILDGETGDSWSQNKKFILHFVNITRLWLHKDSDEKKKKKEKNVKYWLTFPPISYIMDGSTSSAWIATR